MQRGKNTMLVVEKTKGVHTLTIFLNRSIFLLTHQGAFLSLPVAQIVLIVQQWKEEFNEVK
jgi:hypothetical protein